MEDHDIILYSGLDAGVFNWKDSDIGSQLKIV